MHSTMDTAFIPIKYGIKFKRILLIYQSYNCEKKCPKYLWFGGCSTCRTLAQKLDLGLQCKHITELLSSLQIAY